MIRRLQDKLRTLGWLDTLVYIVARLVQRASLGSASLRKYYFVAQPVQANTTRTASSSGNTRVYVAERADAVITQAERPLEVIAGRFAQHARCVVAERQGELAGFIWLCPQIYHEDEVRCDYRWTPSEAAVWDFDVFVAPQYRMGRLFARLWESAHALLHSENVHWTLSRIDAFNANSLAVHRKLGARDLARGWFLVLGRVQLAAFSVAPYVHVSAQAGRRPEICLDLSAMLPRDAPEQA